MAKQKITREQVSSQIDIRYLKQINNNLGYIARLEQTDYDRNKKEKYQVNRDKQKQNNSSESEKNKLTTKQKSMFGGSSNILGDLIGFFSKLATGLIVYKIVDWASKPENKEKVVKLLKLTKGITDFVVGFVDVSMNALGGTTEFLSGAYTTFTEFLGGLFEFGKFLVELPFKSGVGFVTALSSIPDNFGKIQKNIESSLFSGITEAAETGVKDAQAHITSGVSVASSDTPVEPKTEIESGNDISIKPASNDSISNSDISKVSIEPVSTSSASIDKNSVASMPDASTLPKLAKGGVVASNNTANKPNIKPLSALTELTDNNKFSQGVTSIIPDFVKLMQLPFTVIGTGIVSILQSSGVDNPAVSSIISPVINSIGKLFNVSTNNPKSLLSDNKTTGTIVSTDNNSKQKLGSDTILDIFGKSIPTLNTSDSSGIFNSSNDTSIRGLLADILNAFIMKSNMNTPAESTSASTPQRASGGWIHGPQSGYPVSLDGKKTDFIGHGTEWVGQHDSKSSAFVVPFDTPSTRGNKGLTSKRIQEASKAGYGMPQMASGGELSKLVKPIDSDIKSSGFGMRRHPVTGQQKMHKGTDYAIPVGTVVKSAGVGTVTFAGTQSGYGYCVYIKHANGEETRYAHLSQIDVKVGQAVAQGTRLGLSGGAAGHPGAGTSTGPHLHFETRSAAGEPLDPVRRVGAGQIDTTAVANNSSSSSVATAESTSQVAPLEKDWGKIGDSFKTLTQMLGMGSSTAPTTNPKPINNTKLPTRASGGEVKNKVLVNRTGSKDSHGLEKLSVRVFGADGAVLTNLSANSGVASKQTFVNGGQSEAGSMMPFEFGSYSIGDDTPGNPLSAVGKTFMPLNPNFSTKRSAIGAHLDANRSSSPGSAGCLAFENIIDFNNFHDTVRKAGITKLEFQSSNSGLPPTSSNSSTTASADAASSTSQVAPLEKDWGKIGDSFKTLTQMLGMGSSSSSNIKPQGTNATKPIQTENSIKPISNSTLKKFNSTPNNTKKVNNTQVIKSSNSGDTNNISSSNTVASISFDFNSDAYRFTTSGSVFGDVTSTVGV